MTITQVLPLLFCCFVCYCCYHWHARSENLATPDEQWFICISTLSFLLLKFKKKKRKKKWKIRNEARRKHKINSIEIQLNGICIYSKILLFHMLHHRWSVHLSIGITQRIDHHMSLYFCCYYSCWLFFFFFFFSAVHHQHRRRRLSFVAHTARTRTWFDFTILVKIASQYIVAFRRHSHMVCCAWCCLEPKRAQLGSYHTKMCKREIRNQSVPNDSDNDIKRERIIPATAVTATESNGVNTHHHNIVVPCYMLHSKQISRLLHVQRTTRAITPTLLAYRLRKY